MPFDQVLGLATCAIDGLVEPLCGAFGKVGDYITDVGAFLRCLEPRQDAAGAGPGFRGLTCRGETAHLVQLSDGTPDADIMQFGEHLFGQDFVWPQAKNVFDAVVIAPVHAFLPTVLTVAAKRDDRGWPMHPDAADQPAQMGTHLFAVRRLARTQDRDHAMACLRVMDMDRLEASLIPRVKPVGRLHGR